MIREQVLTALVLTALAMGATVISCGLGSTLEPFDQVKIAGLPELDYCEIRTNPERYNGKVVRIRAKLSSFIHGLYFHDERCGVKSYEGLLDDNRTAVTFFEPKRSELYDTVERIRDPNVPREPVEVIAVGRFTRGYPTGQTDHISDRSSYHFELYLVEPTPSPD